MPSLLDALSKEEVENPAWLPLAQEGSSDEEAKARETFMKILAGTLTAQCDEFLTANDLPRNDFSRMVYMAVCLAKGGERPINLVYVLLYIMRPCTSIHLAAVATLFLYSHDQSHLWCMHHLR